MTARRRRLPKLLHRGVSYARTAHPSNDLERLLADEWERANVGQHGINTGLGRLYDLMTIPRRYEPGRHRAAMSASGLFVRRGHWAICWSSLVPLRRRDAVIAATVIQWLGSGVGFAWLCDVLRKAGYRVERIRDEKGAA